MYIIMIVAILCYGSQVQKIYDHVAKQIPGS